ncbi:4256_t:CDS:1 [Entrophospora sp. SA101]|nr:7446_t:CDS:1 [Entrophospora sp. SA101]CAJ0832827.1 4256_t:CDS:1 [Entrophospora sp. SA101]
MTETNPWVYLSKDIKFLITHSYEFIVEFVLRNSIFSIYYSSFKTYYKTRAELDFRYLDNIASALYVVVTTLLSFTILFFYPVMMLRALERKYIRSSRLPNKYNKERWFFINGVCITKCWLDQNCNYLEERFDRGVTGILNKSYGVIYDIIEVILQRSFEIDTISVRASVEEILPALRNKQVNTVRLIAHSQGCIIANLVLRRLYTELSYTGEQNFLNKLEVYTFASASREFTNPGNLVKRIEHYANDQDPIATFGVLNEVNNPRYKGEVFVNYTRNGGKGHLFNTFYSLNKDDYETLKSDMDGIPTFLQLSGHINPNLPIEIKK